MLVKTPEYINITDSSILSVEYSADGPFVTMNDDAVLSRFVSCYKAGNPSQGEDQTVRGVKTFEDRVKLQNLSSKGADNTGATILDNLFRIDIAGTTKVSVGSSGIAFTDPVIASKQVRIIPPSPDYKALNIEGSLTGVDSYTNADSPYASIGESDHPFPRAYLQNAQTGILRLGFSDGDGSVRCYTETTQGAYSEIKLATTHGALEYYYPPVSNLAIPCLKWDYNGVHTRDILPQESTNGYSVGSSNNPYTKAFFKEYDVYGDLYAFIKSMGSYVERTTNTSSRNNVLAWCCARVYKESTEKDHGDKLLIESSFGYGISLRSTDNLDPDWNEYPHELYMVSDGSWDPNAVMIRITVFRSKNPPGHHDDDPDRYVLYGPFFEYDSSYYDSDGLVNSFKVLMNTWKIKSVEQKYGQSNVVFIWNNFLHGSSEVSSNNISTCFSNIAGGDRCSIYIEVLGTIPQWPLVDG